MVCVCHPTTFANWSLVYRAVAFVMTELLAIKTPKWVGNICFNRNNFVENFQRLWRNGCIKSQQQCICFYILVVLFYFKTLDVCDTPRLQILQYVFFCFHSHLSRIMPFDEFNVLCSVTSAGKLKNCFIFKRLSVCCFRCVSTSKVSFFNFFTDLAVSIVNSSSFSMTKGESDVTVLSLFLEVMTINLAKFSCVVNTADACLFVCLFVFNDAPTLVGY